MRVDKTPKIKTMTELSSSYTDESNPIATFPVSPLIE